MTKPNPQYPRGRKSSGYTDDAQYEEDREKLVKDEKEHTVPKKSEN